MENNGDKDDLDVNIDNSQLIERSEAIADRIVEEYGIDDIVFDLLQGGEYKDYLDEIIEIKNSLSRTLS